MKLAICHPNVLPSRGGCETYVANLLARLARDGHELHLYASEWDSAALPETIHFHHIPERGFPRFLRPWHFSRACQEATNNAGHDLTIGFDKVAGVDVLYPQGGLHLATVDYSHQKTSPAWLGKVGRWLRYLEPAYWSFRQFEYHQYLNHRPFVIVNSEFVRNHLRTYLGIPPDEIAVLHSASDTDRLLATDRPARRIATREEWHVEPNDLVALFVGMNYRLKGLEPLLRAVALMQDRSRFRLAVVGHPKYGSYERLARNLGIADIVRFIGFKANPRDCYFAADLLVHPTFYDPCSLVVQEARVCGLPVITTKNNGAAELLDPPLDGLVVRDPHQSYDLAAALSHFLDPIKFHAATRAAMRNGRRWMFEDHYRRLMEILREALRRKRAA